MQRRLKSIQASDLWIVMHHHDHGTSPYLVEFPGDLCEEDILEFVVDETFEPEKGESLDWVRILTLVSVGEYDDD